MPEKTPGKPRKSTSRSKETEQNLQKASTVTPIDQAGAGQSQGRARESSTLAGSNEAPTLSGPRQGQPSSGPGEPSARGGSSPAASKIGAHPSADQSGAAKSPSPIKKNIGSSPSMLNPGGSVQAGSVQQGRQTAGVSPSRQELHERIRARAYELFELRGRREGYDQEDWAQAEAEVLKEFEREKSA